MVVNVIFAAVLGLAADFHTPAGQRPAQVGATGTILPGGRILKPWGVQIETGPSPFGLAVNAGGTAATADIGFERSGVTIIEPPSQDRSSNDRSSKSPWRERHVWARTPRSTVPEA